MPSLAQDALPGRPRTDFLAKFVTARSNESPNEESSAERWSRKAAEQARRSAAQGKLTDEPEIDFLSMPQFDTFEEGNAWVLEKIGEWYVRKCGRWQLFQNSQRVPGFKEAEASWKRASGEFLRREGYRDVVSGPINPEAIFFWRVGRDPAGALVNYHPIISAAAKRGDVAFFRRIVSEIKRVAGRKRQHALVLHMLENWLHGFLWTANLKRPLGSSILGLQLRPSSPGLDEFFHPSPRLASISASAHGRAQVVVPVGQS